MKPAPTQINFKKMAVLEKIRSKGVLLIGAVGLALLAFIVGDFLNSGSSYFNKSKETVAKIVGEDINIRTILQVLIK